MKEESQEGEKYQNLEDYYKVFLYSMHPHMLSFQGHSPQKSALISTCSQLLGTGVQGCGLHRPLLWKDRFPVHCLCLQETSPRGTALHKLTTVPRPVPCISFLSLYHCPTSLSAFSGYL